MEGDENERGVAIIAECRHRLSKVISEIEDREVGKVEDSLGSLPSNSVFLLQRDEGR